VLIDAPGNQESHPVGADDFCTRLAEVICDGIVHCCDQPAVVAMYSNHGMCISQVQTACTSGNPNVSQLVHDSRTGYDPAIAGDVIAEARWRVSQCDTSISTWIYERTGFLRMFTGTIAGGAQCWSGDITAGIAPGVFLSCNDPNDSCQLATVHRATCAARVGNGQACIDDLDCADGSYCAPGTVLQASMCAPRLAGGSCNHDLSDHGSWCQSGVCAMGQCVPATRTTVYCSGGLP
jgi:hypothetical protein